MGNQKLIAGAVMVLLNLVLLSPIATSMVEVAVEEEFETYPYDSACANSDCTEAEEDWATSTADRTYYAWNLTNAEAVMAGEEPVYEKLGPFNYEITYTREIVGFDEDAGTLTYTESKAFACAEDTPNDCNTEITQLNIPFQPQVVGATGTAINGIMDLTKVGFAAGVMGIELESFSAAKKTADDLTMQYQGIQAGAMTEGAAVDAATASMMIGIGMYDQFDMYFAAINGSEMNNMSGMDEMITYTQAIQGQQMALAGGDPSGITFTGNASIGDMSYAFESATWITGDDASLTSMQGVLLLAGHCDAFPTATYDEVMADAANGFANVGTMQRASVWGFTAMMDETTPDINATIARDWALCYGVAGQFAEIHGGGDDTWYIDGNVNASTRLMNLLGVDIDNAVATGLLFGGSGTEMPTGLLATNADSTAFGLAAFASMDAATAMATYSLDATQYGAIANWAGGWMTSTSALNMALLGSAGEMTAEQFVNVTFGAEDPVNGGYLSNSLNMGGAWSAVFSPGSPAVDITAEQSANILYGPLGLTGSTGATLFLFGELTGMTPPVDLATMAPGAAMEWNTSTVAMIYGVDENAAAAMRALMMQAIYGDFVPEFLIGTFGSSGQYMTMPLNNWLYGWRDPVSAFVAGDVTDPALGWSKLETNETFYGSGGISTGNASVYVMCTGHNPDCEKGEAVSEDGSNELSWRNMDMMNATFGLVTVQTLDGTTGGFLTGEGDMVDAGGYAVTDIVCDGKDEVKGIPVDDCSATVDPTMNPITAKLVKSFTLLDATTPALPVYFGSEITLMSEDVSGLIIAGSSTSTFYLDTRTGLDLATTPTMDDLQPVFQIVSASEIEDDDAEDMEDAIVHNQEYMTWWTNFDTPFDYVAPLLYVLGISLIAVHFVLSSKDEEWIQE